MKKLSKMYGLPVVILCIIVGLSLIMMNPLINEGGGFDWPHWVLHVLFLIGAIILFIGIYLLIRTFGIHNK